jgi:glycerophosphoryl diester phosphodiesterase
MLRFFLLCLLVSFQKLSYAQTNRVYTAAQAHSHNDYEQEKPFWLAFDAEFGSIEADLYLINDSLLVAHDLKDINPERSFTKLYLNPILSEIKKNNGSVYKNKNKTLQLLIDLKTPAEPTLKALVQLLEPFKNHFAPTGGSVIILVSGSTPNPENFSQYPPYIQFDGRPEKTYTSADLKRIGLISQSFQKYTRWIGEGELPKKDREKLIDVIEETHKKGKKIRFWATPDNIHAWKTLMQLNVDFLNTDRIQEMSDFLKNAPK